jgi:putative hemolysin
MALTLLALLFLLALSAFFSGGETVVLTLRSRHLPVDSRLIPLQRHPLRFLSFVLLGNNLVNVAISAVATAFILSTWGESALTLGTAFLILVLLLIGEIVPKAVATSAAERLAPKMAGPLSVLYRLFTPLAVFLSTAAESLLTLLLGRREEAKLPFTAGELAQAAADGTSKGFLDSREEEILRGILDFGGKTAGEIMTPRPYVIALSIETDPAQAVAVLCAQGLSRVPVYRRTLDEMAGVLYAKDLLRSQALGEGKSIAGLVRPIFAVPEGIQIDHLLAELRGRRTHMALVVDEYGGTSGVVTLEDVLEEILGEIWDEHDILVFRSRRLRDGSWLLRADASRQELKEMGFELPEGFDNLAAWLSYSTGRIPSKGERFTLPGWQLQVVQTTPQRAELVRANHA